MKILIKERKRLKSKGFYSVNALRARVIKLMIKEINLDIKLKKIKLF